MTVLDVATSISLRSLLPRGASAQPSRVVVRWTLRAITLIVFVLATVIGVQAGLAAPAESPTPPSGSRR